MKVYRWVFLYWAFFYVSFCAMRFFMSPKILDRFVADADTLIKLLDGYSKQQLWLFGVLSFGLVLIIGGAVVIIFLLIKNYLHLRKCTRYRDLEYPLMGLFDPIVAIIIAAIYLFHSGCGICKNKTQKRTNTYFSKKHNKFVKKHCKNCIKTIKYTQDCRGFYTKCIKQKLV